MKNGFYISAYCVIDEEGCALNAQIRHDQSIALWKLVGNNVYLVKYWELERLTRCKQHMQPFMNIEHFELLLNELLRELDLSIDQINEIWGMPEYQNRQLSFESLQLPIHSIFHVFSALIDTKRQFSKYNLILALDGGPDSLLDNGFDLSHHYAAAVFNEGKLIAIENISSPAYFWAEASERFKMREGTLMALAEACTCRINIDIHHSVFRVNKFECLWDIRKYRPIFEELWRDIEKASLNLDDRFSEKENRISAYMKILQEVSKRMVYSDVFNLIKKYKLPVKETILSIVGGFALNCPTNTWLMEQFEFADFIAPPCVNDSGISLGIGLTYFYDDLNSKLSFSLGLPYYGCSSNWESFYDRYGDYFLKVSDFDINLFINDISKYPVCWFEGASELGPRALGHRSILSVATTIQMKNLLNKIKQREWWRPVAPIILTDALKEWCEPCLESPYMLHAVKIKNNKIKLVPAVLHFNNSARIQSIDASSSMYNLLLQYYQVTGIPLICNTSLNDKGEPIINTYDELMNFALRKKMPVIYVEWHRIELTNYESYTESSMHKTHNAFDAYLDSKKDYLTSKYGNIRIDDETLDFYVNHRQYFPNDSILSPDLKQKVDDVRRIISENLSS